MAIHPKRTSAVTETAAIERAERAALFVIAI